MSLLSGAALLVTLVDVELFARTVLGVDSSEAARMLVPFLAALPVGALVGGRSIRRLGERWICVAGLLLAAAAYLLVAGWRADVADARLLGLPAMPVGLLLAGFGLGLVIAPLAALALQAVAPSEHGVASAAVVVARTAGMLIGVAALTAWGLFRFNQLTAELNTPLPIGVDQATYAGQLADYQRAVTDALVTEYSEIFRITAALCVLGAVLSVWLTRPRRATAPVAGSTMMDTLPQPSPTDPVPSPDPAPQPDPGGTPVPGPAPVPDVPLVPGVEPMPPGESPAPAIG